MLNKIKNKIRKLLSNLVEQGAPLVIDEKDMLFDAIVSELCGLTWSCAYNYVTVIVRSGVINDVRFFRTYKEAKKNAQLEEDYNPDTDSIVISGISNGVIWCRETA